MGIAGGVRVSGNTSVNLSGGNKKPLDAVRDSIPAVTVYQCNQIFSSIFLFCLNLMFIFGKVVYFIFVGVLSS